MGGPARTADRQTERREKKKKKRVWLLLLLCGIEEEERERKNKVVVGFGGRPVLAPPPPPPRHNTQPKNRNCFLLFLFLCLFVWPLDRVDTISDSTILVWPRSTNFVPTQKVFSHLVCSCFLSFSWGLSCLNSLAKGSGQEKKSGASFSSVTA